MSSGSRRQEETSNQYSRETNHQYNALQNDLPPSYLEAMRNSPYPATYDPARPTAPYPTENDLTRPVAPPYSTENDPTRPVAPPYPVPITTDFTHPAPPYPFGNDHVGPYSSDSKQPSAPGFETVNGNITYESLQNNERYRQWDEQSTRILMQRRLEMEEEFRKARTQRENDLLWMMILTDLNHCGYNYSLLDMMWFWQMQSHLYHNIVSSGYGYDTSWPYYQPMHQVYGGSIGNTDILSSTASSSMIPSTSVVPNTSSVPATTILPTPVPSDPSVNSNELPTNAPTGVASNLPSTEASVGSVNEVASTGLSPDSSAVSNTTGSSSIAVPPTEITVPPIDPGFDGTPSVSSSATVVPSSELLPPPVDSGFGDTLTSGAVPSSELLPPPIDASSSLTSALPPSSEASNLIANVSSSDHAPLLTASNGGSNILDSVQAQSSLTSDAAASAIPTIAPESINLTESANLPSFGDVITTQPSEGLSIPKVFDENLITTQPTFSPGVYSGGTATAVPSHDDGDCCGCDDDTCCDCGGCCCDGDDDCCCDDGDCCDACSGDCGDCGDCDGLDL